MATAIPNRKEYEAKYPDLGTAVVGTGPPEAMTCSSWGRVLGFRLNFEDPCMGSEGLGFGIYEVLVSEFGLRIRLGGGESGLAGQVGFTQTFRVILGLSWGYNRVILWLSSN